jgi:hypothetical protein
VAVVERLDGMADRMAVNEVDEKATRSGHGPEAISPR